VPARHRRRRRLGATGRDTCRLSRKRRHPDSLPATPQEYGEGPDRGPRTPRLTKIRAAPAPSTWRRWS
jgi:hypothetical protein